LLVDSFSLPTGSYRRIYATGVNIAIQKILHVITAEQLDILRSIGTTKRHDDSSSLSPYLARRVDIYVVSFGKVSSEERMAIAADLWAAG